MSLVGQCLQWDRVSSGTMSPVGECLQWDNVSSGTVSQVGQCLQWDSVSSGTVSPVGPCLQWYSVSSGTMSPVEQCLQWDIVGVSQTENVFRSKRFIAEKKYYSQLNSKQCTLSRQVTTLQDQSKLYIITL